MAGLGGAAVLHGQLTYDAPDWDSLYRPTAPWLQYYANASFSHYDTLRGMYSDYRRFWDVMRYELRLRVHIDSQSLEGTSTLSFVLVEPPADTLQIDLHRNFEVTDLHIDGRPYSNWSRSEDFIWVKVPPEWQIDEPHTVTVTYRGKPVKAPRPPWDGGFVWKTDKKGRPWVGVACEGDGAMLWWPCKDQLVDEPDSGLLFRIEIPNQAGLTAVANGNLIDSGRVDDHWKYVTWETSAPINIYNVTLYIGHLRHWSDTFTSQHRQTRGKPLALDYYILDYDLETSKSHFPAQVAASLETFESYWGPFPFWKDGLALVHAPYWGMEHQTAVAYGHNFTANRFGFDYIILHELAHEYWGNSVSAFDFGDVWIHEGLATYTEVLHVERTRGKAEAQRYINRLRKRIRNRYPVMMPRGVYRWLPDNDMYPKGAWIMHTLRHWLAPNDDRRWVEMLRRFYAHFSHSVTTTEQVIEYWAQFSDDMEAFWEQYLMHPSIPTLEYYVDDNGTLCYRWKADAPDFRMPFEWRAVGETEWHRIVPTTQWQQTPASSPAIEWNTDHFYVEVEEADACPGE